MSNKFVVLAQVILFFILNILDAHSTWLVTKPNNFGRERNPLARFFLKKFGVGKGILIFKGVLLTIVGLIIKRVTAHDYFGLNLVMIIGNSLFTYVVINNYKINNRISKRRKS